jgi:hypothetical protein
MKVIRGARGRARRAWERNTVAGRKSDMLVVVVLGESIDAVGDCLQVGRRDLKLFFEL